MNKITYMLENDDPFTRYLFEFVFEILGIQAREIKDPHSKEQPDIFYGTNEGQNCRLRIKQSEEDILWEKFLREEIGAESIDTTIPFDIISAIGSFMGDFGSLEYSNTYTGYPIVNAYTNFLGTLIKERFTGEENLPLWPEGKRCAIGLSHDVDEPDKYAILKNFRPANYILKIRPRDRSLWKRWLKLLKMSLFDKNPRNFWLFNEIMEEESKYGFTSTFFFASMNRLGKWGSHLDIEYDIRDFPFCQVFKEVKENHFEIGLHASYNAYKSSDYLAFEKKKLEMCADVDIRGLRHHFWHTGPCLQDTLKMHEQNGFKYDSSIAFNDRLGFRMNIALPFYPWDYDRNTRIKCLQLPVFCMDGNLFYHPIEKETGLNQIRDYILTIKQLGGLGVIDWHVRTSFPSNSEFRDWGETYINLLRYLASDQEIWVTDLNTICEWVKNRKKTNDL